MNRRTTSWLQLIVSVPTNGASARMRIWRSMKAQGCAALRDGAYLLPDIGEHKYQLQQVLADAEREGGNGWLLTVAPRSAGEAERLQALFDRSVEFQALLPRPSAPSQAP